MKVNMNYVDKHGNNVLQMYLERNEPPSPKIIQFILDSGFDLTLLSEPLRIKMQAALD